MNNIYQKNPLSYSKYLLICLYTLIPLILYGFYKNGLLLYFKGLVTLVYILKPLLIVLTGIAISIIVGLIFKLKDKTRELVFYNILISLCISINTNIYLYLVAISILNVLYGLLHKHLKINFVAIAVLVIALSSYLIKDYTFFNHYEIIKNHDYGIIDFLLGHSIGGIGSTNVILVLIGLVIMSFLPYYKKDIAITGVIIYTICSMWGLILGYNFNEVINLLCSYSVLFALVYIVPINMFSPKKEKYRFIYVALICVITFILVFFFNNVLGVFIAILGVDLVKSVTFLKNFTKKKGN